MKYSQKFDRMIDEIDSSSTTPEQRFALIEFQLFCELNAPLCACIRCGQAEFFIQHEEKNGSWTPILGNCRAFMSLERNEVGMGMPLPTAPFCTSFKSEEEEEKS